MFRNWDLRWLLPFVLSLTACAIFGIAHAQQPRPADPPDVHGMLIIGEKTVYLSHLSMFPPSRHRFQAIFEAELPSQETYTSDRASHPNQRIYTIEPEPFVLQSLNPDDPRPSLATSFQALTIQRGHFEKQKKPNPNVLARLGKVKIKRVLHFREYKLGSKPIPQLRYLLFGKGGELFVAHFIHGAPDFDHVMTVRTVTPSPSEADLNSGFLVEIPNRTNSIKDRLVDSLTVTCKAVNSRSSPQETLRIATGRTLYLEEGELMMPPLIDIATTEEKKAGFP